MGRTRHHRRIHRVRCAGRIVGAFLLGLAAPAFAAEPAFLYSAPITVQQPAAFVQLALPASAYGRSQQSGLQDLRIVDARGERVPFALLAPRASEAQAIEQQRDAVLYPLPRKPATGQPWASPVEVVVQGERISVKRLGGTAPGSTTAGSTTANANIATINPPGWLIDLGERHRDDPPRRALRLAWSGPAEFSAPFDLEVSDDLRHWRSGGHGQVMALVGAAGPLTQDSVMLAGATPRFIRLVWRDAAAAPVLTGATLLMRQQRTVALDTPMELQFTANPEPVGKLPLDNAAKRALHFDLGGALPIIEIDLQLAPSAGAGAGIAASSSSSASASTGAGSAAATQVAPVLVQGRSRIDEPWHPLAQAVFHRLERGGAVSRSPPVPLLATVRYVRVVPDERAAPLSAGQTRLIVQAPLASLVFAAHGQPPFALLAGSPDARPSALPATTLVPALEDERPRFGRAALGEWSEVAAVAKQAEAAQRMAALRPWLLWAVLLAGVAGLGFMVWRLARGRASAQPAEAPPAG